jgi:uncharacterized protein (DUF1499 family)
MALLFLVSLSALIFDPDPTGLSKQRPPRLRPCPDTPNCVHTGDGVPAGILPFRLTEGARTQAPGDLLVAVLSAVESLPRTQGVITEVGAGFYLRAESRSRVFRFVDDVEVLWTPGSQELQVRSAARVGRGDLGVNQRRVETLRRKLVQAGLILP